MSSLTGSTVRHRQLSYCFISTIPAIHFEKKIKLQVRCESLRNSLSASAIYPVSYRLNSQAMPVCVVSSIAVADEAHKTAADRTCSGICCLLISLYVHHIGLGFRAE